MRSSKKMSCEASKNNAKRTSAPLWPNELSYYRQNVQMKDLTRL